MNRSLTLSGDGGWVVDQSQLDLSRPSGSTGQGTGAPALDLASVIRTLVHWRWLILATAVLGLLLEIVVTLLTTPLYRAFVTLEVNPPTVEIMEEKDRTQGPGITNWDFVTTQIGLLSSKAVALRAAQDLNLANDKDLVGDSGTAAERLNTAADLIADGIQVEAPESGTLIRFSYTSDSPERAASIANQVATSFIDSSLQRRYDASAYARNFLSKQINKTRADLEKSERQLVAYAQAQGIINTAGPAENGASPGDTNSLQGESLVALNRALAEATARRVAAEGAYRQGSRVGTTSEVTASVAPLRQQLAQLQADYQQKRTLMKPDHPEMLSLQSQIDELRKQISQASAEASSGRSNTLLAEYRGAAAAERALQGRVSALKGSVLNLRGRSIQYNILQREVDTNRGLYDALLQRYKEVGVAGGVGSSPVSIVDSAEVPSGPYEPNLLFNLLVGLVAGFVSGIFAAIALDFLYDTVKTREDVRTKLGIACLGAVPKSTDKGGFVEALKDPRSTVSEAYSSVIASLRFSTGEGLPKLLLVTSSRSHEGKSSSALALAQNMARLGNRVVLVDCDLRKPVFRAPNDKLGFTRLLTDERASPVDHVVATQFPGLFLLPAGPIPPNPADLLSSGRVGDLFETLHQHFDLVIVDAPPVLGLADSLLLSTVVGNVMFVIESGKTRTKAALEALNLLRSSNAHVLGATLTKASGDVGGYGYYGYGKGYGYRAIEGKRSDREIQMVTDDSGAEAEAEAEAEA